MKILLHLRFFIACHSFICLFIVAALLNITLNKVWLVYSRKSQEKWTLWKRRICSGGIVERGDQGVQQAEDPQASTTGHAAMAMVDLQHDTAEVFMCHHHLKKDLWRSFEKFSCCCLRPLWYPCPSAKNSSKGSGSNVLLSHSGFNSLAKSHRWRCYMKIQGHEQPRRTHLPLNLALCVVMSCKGMVTI